MSPDPAAKPTPHGVRIAYLAIILGSAIPLTAIAAGSFSSQFVSLIAVAITWIGIALVGFFTLGRTR